MNPDHAAAFKAIYEAESDAIFRFCLIRVSDREQALDITQETFTRLWQSMEKGDTILNNRAYLFTVAHRLIIDWYRKKKSVSLDAMVDEETGVEYDPPDQAAADNLELASEGRYLLDKIKELSPGHRQAVYLRYVEGLSPQEIGDILGISSNAASVRVNRGLDELRNKTGYGHEQKKHE